MKKLRVILLGAILTSISPVSFGSLYDCMQAGLDIKTNYQKAILYCKPYEKNISASNILGSAYYFSHEYKLSKKYIYNFISYSKFNDVDQLTLASAYGILGNIYYNWSYAL